MGDQKCFQSIRVVTKVFTSTVMCKSLVQGILVFEVIQGTFIDQHQTCKGNDVQRRCMFGLHLIIDLHLNSHELNAEVSSFLAFLTGKNGSKHSVTNAEKFVGQHQLSKCSIPSRY